MMDVPFKLPDPKQFTDLRGEFKVLWNAKELGIPDTWKQEMEVVSKQWTIRGLHYQIERPQGKLVRVVSGAITDICLDLRPGTNFGKVYEFVLMEGDAVWVPPGFAHGYIVWSRGPTIVNYKVTDEYLPELERCITPFDPSLHVVHTKIPVNIVPLMSEKDKAGELFNRLHKYY